MARKLIAISALPTSFILGICVQIVWLSWTLSGRYEPKALQGTISQAHEVTGNYYPAHEFPLAFINVRRIDLTAFGVTSDSIDRMEATPKNYLITDVDIYKLSEVNIDGGRLSFTTESRFGLSYQFTGRMLDGSYPIQGYSQYYLGKTIMFYGRIVRLLFGFRVAEGEVKFTKGSAC